MKVKHAVLLLAVGYVFEFLGALRKVTHAPDASAVLVAAVVCKVVAVFLLAYKIITYPGFKKFMEH